MSKTVATSPFAFKPYDERLIKENAVNYIPPKKRKEIADYLSNSSIKLQQGDRGFDGMSSYNEQISLSKAVGDEGNHRPSLEQLKNER